MTKTMIPDGAAIGGVTTVVAIRDMGSSNMKVRIRRNILLTCDVSHRCRMAAQSDCESTEDLARATQHPTVASQQTGGVGAAARAGDFVTRMKGMGIFGMPPQ